MSVQQKIKSRVQEDLLSLYLRLNGYFVTGFIVHSPILGRNKAEIDALAVRFPLNQEPERQVITSQYLEPSDQLLDLLICEVKSGRQRLQFNEALRDYSPAIASVLRWAGMFSEEEIPEIVRQLQEVLQPHNPSRREIPTVLAPRNIQVRGIMCSPEKVNRRDNQPWFIHGTELFHFIWQCFRPDVPRDSCSTRYDFTAWGGQYEKIVEYFKDADRTEPGTIRDLYAHLKI